MVSTNLLNIDGQFDKKVNHIKGEFNIATPQSSISGSRSSRASTALHVSKKKITFCFNQNDSMINKQTAEFQLIDEQIGFQLIDKQIEFQLFNKYIEFQFINKYIQFQLINTYIEFQLINTQLQFFYTIIDARMT